VANEDKAPTCPISYDQEPTDPRGFRGTAPIRLPSIPAATDLASLIRSVNIMRDILRTLTTSLTVNNFYGGRVVPGKQYGKKDYLMSDYFSDWYQTKIDNKPGYVGKNPKQRAYVERIDAVKFRNNARDNDQSLEWRYVKPLTGEGTKGSPFEEDYFERVIKVYWAPTGPSGPTAPSGPSGPPPAPTEYFLDAGWSGRAGPSLACAFFGYSREAAIAEAEAAVAANPNLIYGVFGNRGGFTIAGPVPFTGTPYEPFTPPIAHFTWMVIYAAPFSNYPGFDPQSCSIV